MKINSVQFQNSKSYATPVRSGAKTVRWFVDLLPAKTGLHGTPHNGMEDRRLPKSLMHEIFSSLQIAKGASPILKQARRSHPTPSVVGRKGFADALPRSTAAYLGSIELGKVYNRDIRRKFSTFVTGDYYVEVSEC